MSVAAASADLRRRLTWLMLFRVVLITLVMGSIIVLNLGAPRELAAPRSVALFAIVGLTYALTLIYVWLLRRLGNPTGFADVQVVGDLLITTALVHVTGGAQSPYTFLYPLSIVGAATVRHRAGAIAATLAGSSLYALVSLLGWMRVLPVPAGSEVVPWDLTSTVLVRHLVLNVGAFSAIGVLAAGMGRQLAQSGQRLESQMERAADLSALNQDIIRCLSSGLVTIDADGTVLTFNEAAEEILDVRAEDVIGRPLADVVPAVAAVAAATPIGESRRRAEIRMGQVVLGVSVSPLTDHKNHPLGQILNFQDLSQLRRMEAQMKRAERLAAIGGLAAGVAHELRNPLASISGSIELLRGAPSLVDEDRTLMDIVIREVDRLNGLVDELVEYARPREPVPLHTDLVALLDETVRVFRQDKTHPGVNVLWNRPEGEVEVTADPAQIRQVVWNLLRNAAEALPDGGKLEVSVTPVPGGAEVAVADDGVGIPASDLERIFEPFFTTKTRGTGLGLALVHRIITEHKGTVDVQSTPGQGTRVAFRLGS